MRTYKQNNDDWLRVADVAVAAVLTATIVISEWDVAMIIPLLASLVLVVYLNRLKNCSHKSFVHMCVHLVAISTLLWLLFR